MRRHVKDADRQLWKRPADDLWANRSCCREGHRSGSWVLLDYGCVIVHVFQDEARKFYDLERLWSDAEVVDISDMRA